MQLQNIVFLNHFIVFYGSVTMFSKISISFITAAIVCCWMLFPVQGFLLPIKEQGPYNGPLLATKKKSTGFVVEDWQEVESNQRNDRLKCKF